VHDGEDLAVRRRRWSASWPGWMRPVGDRGCGSPGTSLTSGTLACRRVRTSVHTTSDT